MNLINSLKKVVRKIFTKKDSPELLLNYVHTNRGLLWENIETFRNQLSQVEGDQVICWNTIPLHLYVFITECRFGFIILMRNPSLVVTAHTLQTLMGALIITVRDVIKEARTALQVVNLEACRCLLNYTVNYFNDSTPRLLESNLIF